MYIRKSTQKTPICHAPHTASAQIIVLTCQRETPAKQIRKARSAEVNDWSKVTQCLWQVRLDARTTWGPGIRRPVPKPVSPLVPSVTSRSCGPFLSFTFLISKTGARAALASRGCSRDVALETCCVPSVQMWQMPLLRMPLAVSPETFELHSRVSHLL